MNSNDMARNSYHLATRLEECPFDQFWVVLLDDGTEIYQSEDDQKLAEPNAWIRLKMYCQEQNKRIMHMAYAFRDRPDLQINAVPDADGYFFAKKLGVLMAPHPQYEYRAVGVGSLVGKVLKIVWRSEDGAAEEEVRDITNQMPFTLIIN